MASLKLLLQEMRAAIINNTIQNNNVRLESMVTTILLPTDGLITPSSVFIHYKFIS